MPVNNRIADYFAEMKSWRQHLHANPEVGFDCDDTAGFVVERLGEFGVDQIETGWAKTGVVAVINGQGAGQTIGLRADMDALPMIEETGLAYASGRAGAMHACGHDGHTTMLLGAAKYLAETRKFSGRVVLIFQPAEEAGGGAGVMMQEGLLEKFDISQVYAMHNLPGLEVGRFETVRGPILASVDDFEIDITGQGGHAAHPDQTIDPVVVAVNIVQALQSIVSRNVDPMKAGVLSVTQINVGSANNVIAQTGKIVGTIRAFEPEVREMMCARLQEIVAHTAHAYQAQARVQFLDGYPPTINDHSAVDFAAEVAGQVVGQGNVFEDTIPSMGAEDFAFMLERCKGAYLYIGNGDSADLHNPKFDFNDDISPIGASYFAQLVETAQPIKR
ncbi:amidohydrolase [Amylibacter marinus]|uniref:Amidohydrolase n=1 Tax=Amylibacter marinus TaxID=1475483 RepID=A0ABQ5VRJ1_9RHOB|nr:M20 aminoacylase family protein [Amylibacter marinus]GLQ33954.1 amidohydrolase [Amylibacter marinus]